MNQSVAILGRLPGLGTAELESLLGADKLTPVGSQAVLIDIEPADVPFSRLGGTIKLAKLLTRLETTHWAEIEKFLIDTIPKHLEYIPEGKFTLGLSIYGLDVGPSRINASGLTIKKAIKAAGRGARIVPNKASELNTAQVIHNQLTGSNGWELLLIRDGQSTLLAQTIQIQDIEAYAARDQARPKRDAKVGMLPPKLAQTIVNLAAGKDSNQNMRLLDPFCGTGVVLQESMLMGFNIYGTDIEPRMIEYTDQNLAWLFFGNGEQWTLETADATTHTWQSPVGLIACETYLGRPFSAPPAPEILREVMHDVDAIHKKFLQNVARQTKSGFRMCIAVPAWKTKHGFAHLKVLDNLGDLGYTRSVFKHVDSRDLIYHRPEQVVARELVVLTRK